MSRPEALSEHLLQAAAAIADILCLSYLDLGKNWEKPNPESKTNPTCFHFYHFLFTILFARNV